MTETDEKKTIVGIRPQNLMRIFEEINISAFLDDWGPKNVLQVYNPETGMQGILVIDNTTLGPALGGIRIGPSITPRETFKRARAMTYCCALAEIDLGGAAAAIRADPATCNKDQLIRSFARAVSPHVPGEFVAAPEMNTGQTEMQAFVDEIGDRQGATGKPNAINGIPYEMGVQGFGMGIAIESTLEAARDYKILPPSLSEARIAIQGFDPVGLSLAKYLANNGSKILAISDDWSTLHDSKGIEVNKIAKHSSAPSEKQSIAHFKGYNHLPKERIIRTDCDVLVLISGNEPITETNAGTVVAKCVVGGGNETVSPIGHQILNKAGIVVVPDIIALAGGPISSYAEYNRSCCDSAFHLIKRRVKDAAMYITQRSLELGVPLARVARETAKERLLRAGEVVG